MRETAKAARRGVRKQIGNTIQKLSVLLTQEEANARAQRAAELIGELEAHSHHEAETKAALKAKRTSIENQIQQLSAAARSRQELREVPIRIEADFAAGYAYEIRTDTDEEVNRRPLSDDDRQREMFGEDDYDA